MYLSAFSGGNRSPGATSPTLSVPYSGPVNLLKALNYHSRTAQTGLSLQIRGGREDQHGAALVENPGVQRLAHAYNTEAALVDLSGSCSYRLMAVVVHLGDVFSGHFVTYRRAPCENGQRFPDRWLYTSDTLVKPATGTEVLGSNAYMLFYEKC